MNVSTMIHEDPRTGRRRIFAVHLMRSERRRSCKDAANVEGFPIRLFGERDTVTNRAAVGRTTITVPGTSTIKKVFRVHVRSFPSTMMIDFGNGRRAAPLLQAPDSDTRLRVTPFAYNAGCDLKTS